MEIREQVKQLRAAVRRVYRSHQWEGYDPTGDAKRQLARQAAHEVRRLVTSEQMARIAADERAAMVATYAH